MKKSEIVEHVGREVAMRKGAADAVDAVFSTVAGSLARGEDVAVAGFGRFSRKSRPAREGRSPARTGEPVSIGPSATVSFRAAGALKDALN